MHKPVLLAATSVLALTSGVAMAGWSPGLAAQTSWLTPIQSKGKTLYSQNSNFVSAPVASDNFTSGDFGISYNSAGADDFVVPKGKTWKITGVDVSGVYELCSTRGICNGATSQVVTFYADANGLPGAMVGKPQSVHCSDNSGNFSCTVKPVSLKGRKTGNGTRYWVSVVANMDVAAVGEWYWQETRFHGDPAVWENPGGGLENGDCKTWAPNGTCIYYADGDYAFDLKGKSE